MIYTTQTPISNMIQQSKTLIIVIICLAFYMALIIWGDYARGILARPAAYVGIILGGIAITFPGLRIARTRKISAVVLAIFIVFIISLNFISLSPIRPFKRFFYDVHPGMTRTEVQNLLQTSFQNSTYYLACFPLDKPNSDPDDMGCSLRPINTFSNQSIEVYYKNQRVVKVMTK
jgi:hypothetical protein